MPGNVGDLGPWTIGVEICLRIFWGFRVLASNSYGWIVLSVTVTELSTLTYFPLKISSLLFANFKVNPSTLSTKYNPSSNKPSLVVVTESPSSDRRKKKIFEFIDSLLQKTGKIGKYDQKI